MKAKKLLIVVFLCKTMVCMDTSVESKVLAEYDPLGDGKSYLALLRVSGTDPDIVHAARVSRGRREQAQEMSAEDIKLAKNLVEWGHETPMEFTQLVFYMKIPLPIMVHFLRQRIAVDTVQKSARYGEMPAEAYMPAEWRAKDVLLPEQQIDFSVKYLEAVAKSYAVYKEMITAGIKPEVARLVLPEGTYTEATQCYNLRSLFNTVKLRSASGAQWETQQYAKTMLRMAKPYFPETIGAWCKKNKFDWIDEPLSVAKPAVTVEKAIE